ncbi:hypothetical protein GBAR_LOCUS15273, partial [Geodia barretti]
MSVHQQRSRVLCSLSILAAYQSQPDTKKRAVSHGLCIASKPQEKYCAKDTSRSLQWKYNGIEVFGLSFDG